MNREEIMKNCPEEFKVALGDFIDDVESKFVDIQSELTIQSVDDLDQVKTAFDLASEAAKELY